jgi:hypothetical protein
MPSTFYSIIGTSPDKSSERFNIFHKAKGLYGTRSDIVHSGTTEVPEDDLESVRRLALLCLLWLLNDMPEIERFQDLVDFCQRGKFEAGVELDAGNAQPSS